MEWIESISRDVGQPLSPSQKARNRKQVSHEKNLVRKKKPAEYGLSVFLWFLLFTEELNAEFREYLREHATKECRRFLLNQIVS